MRKDAVSRAHWERVMTSVTWLENGWAEPEAQEHKVRGLALRGGRQRVSPLTYRELQRKVWGRGTVALRGQGTLSPACLVVSRNPSSGSSRKYALSTSQELFLGSNSFSKCKFVFLTTLERLGLIIG